MHVRRGRRVCVGTWNAGGKAPPDDLDIAEWLGTGGDAEPADMYVYRCPRPRPT